MTNAIAKEAGLRQDYLNEHADTIYFGGGTPSLLEKEHTSLLFDSIRSNFPISNEAEITLEANPDDITQEKLAAWKDAGINRLSIGVQSFFDEDLLWMNRAHNAREVLESIEMAQQAGFHNITIDLIYGTPALTDEKWIHNIETALQLNIPHLSCYALTVEPRTALQKKIEKKKLQDVNPEQQSRQFELLMLYLQTAGYEQYEISNFAKPGNRSRHNSSYWKGSTYLGLGPAAHSFNNSSRQWNIANNALYIKSIENGMVPFEIEMLTETQQLNEYIMTSMRTSEGISLHTISVKWGIAPMKNLQQALLNLFSRN